MVVFRFLNPLSSCGYCMRTFISQFSFSKAEYFILFVPVAGFLVLEHNYLDRHTLSQFLRLPFEGRNPKVINPSLLRMR